MKILLIDLSAVFWRNWHATRDQQVSEAFQLTVNTINARRHNYDYCAVCCDHAPYKRKAICAEYKAQRDTPDPIAVGQLRRVKERLESDGVLLWDAEGYESDDLIATACAQLTKDIGEESDLDIVVLTCDKDLYSLLSDRVSIVRLDSGEHHGPDECVAKLGVPPSKIPELLALMGDTSDNVPGCRGVGLKTAQKLLSENGSVANILDPEKLKAEGKLRESLIANREAIAMSYKLVTLMTDAPIDVKQLFESREVKALEKELTPEDFDTDDGAELPPLPPPAPAAAPEPETKLATVTQIQKPAGEIQVYQASFERQLEPRTQGQAFSLAKGIINSRQFGFQNEYEAHAVILTGREMGLTAMASIRSISFFKNKPCLSAALMEALVLRSGKAEYFECESSDNTQATYITKRVGAKREQRQQFTLKDADKAQLTKANGNWDKYPKNMCEWRAIAFLARRVYPDVILGMYTREELEEVA